MSGMTRVWDSSDTGEIYVDSFYVEYCRNYWTVGTSKTDIVRELRNNGLPLLESMAILNYIEQTT